MTDEERALLLAIARIVMAEYPNKPGASFDVTELHFLFELVEETQRELLTKRIGGSMKTVIPV